MSTLAELCNAVGGRQAAFGFASIGDSSRTPLGPVVSDSRAIEPGNVFWALRGPNHQGENFLDEAFRRGAQGAVVAKDAALDFSPLPKGDGTNRWIVRVDDTLKALADWARWRRKQCAGTVIDVTGSAGKTTTRQMIHTVLQSRMRGTASPQNFNNNIGVPLSMISIEPNHDYAVLELGANRPGEIAELAELSEPKVGVITCIGNAHLAGFGGLKQVAQAKAELLAALPKDGRAVLGDDPWLRKIAGDCKADITWVGVGEDCDFRATDVQNTQGRLSFRVEDCQFSVPVWGRHHLTSALAAVAVGRIMGFDLDEIARSLYKFHPMPMRCQVREIRGASVINDAYNSNPTAMEAALTLLRDFNAPGQRIVVAGDMGELGEKSASLHKKLGKQVVEIAGARWLIACGEFARQVVEGARSAGMPRIRTICCRNAMEALPYLDQAMMPGDVILVKGSRMMRMECLVEAMEHCPKRRIAN